MNGISLVDDTISNAELDDLADWIKTYPRLTKGELTKQFERKWSLWQNATKSIFVNSGSSANLLMAAALKYSGNIKNNVVIAPTVSWGTTVAPFMQLGFDVHLCDCENDSFGVDVSELEKLFVQKNPAILIIVHVLGVPNKMNEIVSLCKKYDVVLVEDCCEAHGAQYENKKVGTFGEMSSFSYYYGHHMSTIEGGMVSFNSEKFYEISLMLRSHGWVRDLPDDRQRELINENKIDEFNSLYFFVHPGFNIRSTEINAFLGLRQLEKLDEIVKIRNGIWHSYHNQLSKIVRTQTPSESIFISPLAFGLISEKRSEIVKVLKDNLIECRPLICGSIHKHPFWSKPGDYKNANVLHEFGMYIPVHQNMKIADTEKISCLIKSVV